MGASPPVYTSVSGPAKWAAVILLSFVCGGGLVYSFTRSPRRSEASQPQVRDLPAREAAKATPVAPPVASGAPQQPTPPATLEQPKAVPPSPEQPAAPQPSEETLAPASADVPAMPMVQPTPEPPPQPAATTARRININKATQAELELLPRVGPAMAKAIISYRSLNGPFRTVQDLDKVKGIGPKTLEKLAPLVTVE